MARSLRDFLYTVGISPLDYPLVSKLQSTFIDGQKKEITDEFKPFENVLKADSLENLNIFLSSIEEQLKEGEKVKFDRIQISTYAITFNPFTPQLQLFMRDV